MTRDLASAKRTPPLLWREVIWATLFLTALLFLFFWPSVFTNRVLLPTDLIFQLDPLWQPLAPEGFAFPGNQLLFDQVYVFYPWAYFTQASLEEGDLPLWNPYSNAGQPFLANAQSALFSPFTLLACPFALNKSFAMMTFLPLFIAGLFAFLLARDIGISRVSALISMITYTFSGPMIAWAGHPLPKVFAWLPALLFFGRRALTRRSWAYTVATSATIAVQFLAGHPETSFHVMIVWFAFSVYCAVMLHGWRPSRFMGAGVRIAVSAAVGLAAAAVQVLPCIEFLLRSTILATRAASSKSPVFLVFPNWHDWPTAMTALLPRFFGTPLDGSYWYPHSNYNEQTVYAGVLPLVLAVVSAICILKKQRSYNRGAATRLAPFFLCLAIISFGVALRLPIFHLVNRLPVFRLASNGRLRNVYVFAIAILAGFGFDHVLKALSLRQAGEGTFVLRTMRVTLVVVALLGLLASLASYAGLVILRDDIIRLGRDQVEAMQGHPFYPYSLEYYYRQVDVRYEKMVALFHPRHVVMYLPVVIGGSAFGLCKWLLRANRRAKRWMTLLVVLIFLDLFLVGVSYNPTIPPEQVYPMPEAIRFLRQDRDIFRVAGLGLTLMPNSGMMYGLSDVRGYDAVIPKRYLDLFDQVEGSVRITHFWLLMEADSPLLDLLNVKYLLTEQVLAGKWQPVFSAPDGMTVYRNTKVMPRAFVAHRAESVDGAEQSLALLTDDEFDYRTTVILEGPSSISLPDEGSVSASEEVSIVGYEPERVDVRTSTTADGFLVLTDGYDPGWRAEIDGQPTEVYVADHAFRAVALPSGQHQVTFVYEPLAYEVGLAISLLVLACVTGACLWLVLDSHRRVVGG